MSSVGPSANMQQDGSGNAHEFEGLAPLGNEVQLQLPR
jgi:hypothetical protein